MCACAFAWSGACDPTDACRCTACGAAVTLNVFDENEQPLSRFAVEASVDGEIVSTQECNDPNARLAPSSCSFGSSAGVYRVRVTSDGYRTVERAVRFAARSGEDCCSLACLDGGITVAIVLEREEQ